MPFLKCFLILFLPSRFKIFILKRLGWTIGNGCYIGFSLIQAKQVYLGDNVYIGHLNVLRQLKRLSMGSGSRININNWITGSNKGSFILGDNSSISVRHYFDASADITIGSNSIVAGRDSQFFTHGITPDCLDSQKSIKIGDWCYIGSGVRCVPGSEVPSHVFVGMGSVITKKLNDEYVLLAGSPAKVKKNLDKKDIFFDRSFLPHAHHHPLYNGNCILNDNIKNKDCFK